jgi:flagellar export protein FliJ
VRKFQFSLRAALVMRERAVEAAELALRVVQEEWNANQQRQQDLVDEVKAAELAVQEGPVVDPADYIALDRFRMGAQRRRMRLAQDSIGIGKRLAERRGLWQLAERDRTLLIRLEEKAKARWMVEYDREQQQLAEEAYLSRWNAR